MPFIADRVLDLGLTVLTTEVDRIHICNTEPTTYAQAVGSASLGSAGDLSISGPAARTPSGRRVTLSGDGAVTVTGTATHWAIVDTVNTRLLATGSLAASQAVTEGNAFTLGSFDVGIPGAA